MFSNPTGIGRYSRELLRRILLCDSEHSYTLFHSNQYQWPPSGDGWTLPENVRVQALPYSRKQLYLAWFLYGGPYNLKKLIGAHKIYHELGDILLPLRRARTIASLHDVFTSTIPESSAWHSRLLFRKSRRQLRQADAIITVSNFSRQQIVEHLRVSPEAVTVIQGGVSSTFQRIDDPERIRTTCVKYGIEGSYFLFVGVFNRRKNLGSLLRAYRVYRSRRRADRALLVCCGRPGVGSAEFFKDIRELGLFEDAKIVQGASDRELAELMSGCRALVLPSLGEGFGLPIAEAMACGAPVICGNRCAMAEVAEGAGLLVDPTNIGMIADAMEQIVTNPVLADSLRARGLMRAKHFSWDRTARQVLDLYQHVLSKPRACSQAEHCPNLEKKLPCPTQPAS